MSCRPTLGNAQAVRYRTRGNKREGKKGKRTLGKEGKPTWNRVRRDMENLLCAEQRPARSVSRALVQRILCSFVVFTRKFYTNAIYMSL